MCYEGVDVVSIWRNTTEPPRSHRHWGSLISSLNFTVLFMTLNLQYSKFRTGKGHFLCSVLLLYQIIAIRELHFFHSHYIYSIETISLWYVNMCLLVACPRCVIGDFMCMPVSHKWFIHMDFPRPICFIGAWLFHIRQKLLVPRHKHRLNSKRVGPWVRGDVLSDF